METSEDRQVPSSRGKNGIASRLILLALIVFLLLVAALHMVGQTYHLAYLLARATTFDVWSALSLASVLLTLTAIIGAGVSLWRRRLFRALLFAVLPLPVLLVMAGSSCHHGDCRLVQWASLRPGPLVDWSIRLRPVEDENEARWIASSAVSAAGLDGSAFQTRRFDDHWLVSMINSDGEALPHAVRIDGRSGRTRIVPCPADRIRCGMAWPILADGRRPFSNPDLGITAVFPADLPVCIARNEDDDAPRGFVGIYRSSEEPCDAVTPDRQLGVEVAYFPRLTCPMPTHPDLDWRPLSDENLALFANGAPTLAGQPSLACELRQGGHIQISVYGPMPPPGEPGVPRYEAFITTTPEDLPSDIRRLESLLETVILGSPRG